MKNIVDFGNVRIMSSIVVFNPRVETEFWVQKAVVKIRALSRERLSGQRKKGSIRVLDIFAGTGCIGIYVLKNLESSVVDFVDVSGQAVEQIEINLKLNKVSKKRYRIFKSDMFEGLTGQKYDFIFANPPYVAQKRIAELGEEVLRTDPSTALFGGAGGMDYILRFLNEVKNYLKPWGMFFLEFDPQQKEEIERILKEKGFDFHFHQDQFNEDRWVEIRLPLSM